MLYALSPAVKTVPAILSSSFAVGSPVVQSAMSPAPTSTTEALGGVTVMTEVPLCPSLVAVIVGHDHEYERFAPQTPNAGADPVRGIREFVVGTGGAGLYSFATPLPNSEVRDNTSHGVLKLSLSDGSYTWQYIPVAGNSFTDSGSGTCH